MPRPSEDPTRRPTGEPTEQRRGPSLWPFWGALPPSRARVHPPKRPIMDARPPAALALAALYRQAAAAAEHTSSTQKQSRRRLASTQNNGRPDSMPWASSVRVLGRWVHRSIVHRFIAPSKSIPGVTSATAGGCSVLARPCAGGNFPRCPLPNLCLSVGSSVLEYRTVKIDHDAPCPTAVGRQCGTQQDIHGWRRRRAQPATIRDGICVW